MRAQQRPQLSTRLPLTRLSLQSAAFALVMLSFAGCSRDLSEMLGPLLEAPASSRPRIISSNPSESGGAYNPSLPVYVDFDRQMDAFSTERAFSLTGAGKSSGEFRWIGNRLVYDLIAPLDPGIAFVLRVSGSAKSASNAPLEVDYIVHFISGSTIAAPVVLSNTPSANSQAVPQNSNITLVFSRSMNRESVEQAFRINPAVPGAFLWSANDTTMTFQPYSDLQAPVRYSISLGTTATDREGISLHTALSFSFQTGDDLTRPTIQEIREQGAIAALTDGFDGVQKESPLVITFSEPMQATDTEKAISLVRRHDQASVKLQSFWSPTFQSLTIKAEPELIPETDYRLTISTAAKDRSTNALLEDYRLDFRVSNAAGAVNSEFMRLDHAEKTSPEDVQSIGLSSDEETLLSVDGSDLATSGAAGVTAQIVLDFSHSLTPASLPECFSISKVLGSHPASGRILGIAIQNNGALTDSRVVLTIGGLGAGNEYRLRITGGKESTRSIKSTEQPGENPTYLKDSIILNLRIEDIP